VVTGNPACRVLAGKAAAELGRTVLAPGRLWYVTSGAGTAQVNSVVRGHGVSQSSAGTIAELTVW
jgi:hypothetical protein